MGTILRKKNFPYKNGNLLQVLLQYTMRFQRFWCFPIHLASPLLINLYTLNPSKICEHIHPPAWPQMNLLFWDNMREIDAFPVSHVLHLSTDSFHKIIRTFFLCSILLNSLVMSVVPLSPSSETRNGYEINEWWKSSHGGRTGGGKAVTGEYPTERVRGCEE